MATTVDETPIRDIIETTYEAIDPSLDTQKGPLRRIYLDPHRNVVGLMEDRVNRLIALFTQQRPNNMTSAEYEALIRPFGGIARFAGDYARGFVVVYAYTKPPAELVVPFGAVFTDDTGTLLYSASAEVRFALTTLDGYYNPTARRYEFPVPIVSKEVGDQYAVPPDRITKVTTDIPYISGCNNNDALTGGLPAESDLALDARFQARLEGTDNGSKGTVGYHAASAPRVQAAVLVSPGSPYYSRRTRRPATDIHVIGDNTQQAIQTITVVDPTRRLYQFLVPDLGLPRRATGITSVVDGNGTTLTNWVLVPDATRLGRSVYATTYIEFTSGFPLDTQLTVTYQFNQLLEDTQSYLGATVGSELLFDTSLLVFSATPVPLTVEFTTRTLTSTNNQYILQQLRDATLSILNPNNFLGSMTPDEFKLQLQMEVPAASPQFVQFHRQDSNQPVEVLFFTDIEYPTLASADLYITTD
jgi:hypothetical protein